jgi:hypothetical protein
VSSRGFSPSRWDNEVGLGGLARGPVRDCAGNHISRFYPGLDEEVGMRWGGGGGG